MSTSTAQQNVFREHFDRLEPRLCDHMPSWLGKMRRAAIGRVAERGLPSKKDEDWRRTPLAPLLETPFAPGPLEGHRVAPTDASPVLDHGATGVPPVLDGPWAGAHPSFQGVLASAGALSKGAEQSHEADLQAAAGPRLVFVDGVFAPALSVGDGLAPNVYFGSLTGALRADPDLVGEHFGRCLPRDHAFAEVNTALFADGGLLIVPPETVLDTPIHLVCISTEPEQPVAVHPRHLIVVGRHAQATVVETYIDATDISPVHDPGATGVSPVLTNSVTEILLDDGARLDHYLMQRQPWSALHLSNVAAVQRASSHFETHLIALGGSLARHETGTRLEGEGSHATLNGLYMPRGEQHLECRTRIDHAVPHCTSHEVYKGIIDDRGVGVFNGKIFVHQDAQKTDAKQSNQALLLSDLATINTKPQLEIFADDVRCTHGATVGQLDAEALFYLRSRGLSDEHARSLLIYAFAGEVVEGIRLPLVRHQVEQVLLDARGLPPEVAVDDGALDRRWLSGDQQAVDQPTAASAESRPTGWGRSGRERSDSQPASGERNSNEQIAEEAR